MNIFLKSTQLLTEPANHAVNHAIDKVGQSSIVTGVLIKSAEHTGVIQEGLKLTEWAAVVAITGGLLYIVKLVLEIIITSRKLSQD